MEGHVTCIQHAEVAGVEPMPIHILLRWLYHGAVKMRLCLSMGAAAAGAPGRMNKKTLFYFDTPMWVLGSFVALHTLSEENNNI